MLSASPPRFSRISRFTRNASAVAPRAYQPSQRPARSTQGFGIHSSGLAPSSDREIDTHTIHHSVPALQHTSKSIFLNSYRRKRILLAENLRLSTHFSENNWFHPCHRTRYEVVKAAQTQSRILTSYFRAKKSRTLGAKKCFSLSCEQLELGEDKELSTKTANKTSQVWTKASSVFWLKLRKNAACLINHLNHLGLVEHPVDESTKFNESRRKKRDQRIWFQRLVALEPLKTNHQHRWISTFLLNGDQCVPPTWARVHTDSPLPFIW